MCCIYKKGYNKNGLSNVYAIHLSCCFVFLLALAQRPKKLRFSLRYLYESKSESDFVDMATIYSSRLPFA